MNEILFSNMDAYIQGTKKIVCSLSGGDSTHQNKEKSSYEHRFENY